MKEDFFQLKLIVDFPGGGQGVNYTNILWASVWKYYIQICVYTFVEEGN